MQFLVGDMDECRDIAVQIQQGMEFDSRFDFAKPSPWEQRQGTGLWRRNPTHRPYCRAPSHNSHHRGRADVKCESVVVRKVCVDAPVALLIGVGQRISRDATGIGHDRVCSLVPVDRFRCRANFLDRSAEQMPCSDIGLNIETT